MEFVRFHSNYTRNIFIRILIAGVLVVVLLVWKLDFIVDVYFRNQITATGWVLNGGILSLFLLGIGKIAHILFLYRREEDALARFVDNLEIAPRNPLDSIPAGAIIESRFQIMRTLHQKRAHINHGALASTLQATESTRNNFPRFINNILILTGVFGTIISLSIALLGASDMLESVIDSGGMGLVIHGMSTALSTTMTAILCYLFFGYIYQKLTDAQTNLLSAVEQVTTVYLLPRFQVQTDSILYEFSGLIRSLQSLVTNMAQSQRNFQDVEERLIGQMQESQRGFQEVEERLLGQMRDAQQSFQDVEERWVKQIEKSQENFCNVEERIAKTIDDYRAKVQDLATGMQAIRGLLRKGFRLPEDEA